ncbi:MAG: SAM-dependent methyltransferase [Xanthomonadales bacterium]|nr:SAM-dependent methyltransferase [Xanthomonadales bacterium]
MTADRSPAEPAAGHRLPEPDADALAHSQHLAAHISEQITAHGPLPFDRFMDLALYAPGLGYYSAGARKFGASGDFITAPELGPAFAHALGHCLQQTMAAIADWHLLEVGGGSGVLAADLLTALAARNVLPARYLILEVSADLRQRQRQTLSERCPELIDRVHWLDAPPQQPWQGALIANEVVDALPATRFQLDEDGVFEETVTIDPDRPDRFVRGRRPAAEGLAAMIQDRLGPLLADLPRPYASELHGQLDPWLAGLTQGLQRGLALFIDYGYPRSEYYLPERRDGTLVCHYRHRAHDDPLILSGLQDITAFVDFTALAEAGERAGLDLAGYTSQVQFLLGNDIEGYLASLDALSFAQRLAAVHPVKALMLPGQMGERFQVMAFSRGLETAATGFDHDLRHRL